MDNIFKLVTAILVLIIIFLTTYMAVKSKIYNKAINQLTIENKSLISRISSAESYIDMQNHKIAEHSNNMQLSLENYNKNIKTLNEKYSNLKEKYKNIGNLKCQEVLNIIDENQRRYLDD